VKVEDQKIYILHSYPFKETSLLVEVFSQNYGRLSLLAKGARRPRSVLRGYLQPFQQIQATWSGVGELKTLFGVEWSSCFLGLQNQSLICGFYLNELLIKLLPREDPNPKLFDFYHKVLERLAKREDFEKVLRLFELRFLKELGYEVGLEYDVKQNKILPHLLYFYEAEYGASPFLKKTNNGIKLNGQTLIDMANEEYSNPTTIKQSKLLMRYLISFYLDNKDLKTRELFIKN
jgi:DNA repair protein RecO (recombination protein O)